MSKYWNYKKTKPEISLHNQAVAAREHNRRHWRYVQVNGPSLPLQNSPEPFHVVTHREIGDIPGCTLAPREHTFRDCSAEEAAGQTLMRAQLYAAEVQKYVSGEYGGDHGLEDMWGGVAKIKPLFGPHGEKL